METTTQTTEAGSWQHLTQSSRELAMAYHVLTQQAEKANLDEQLDQLFLALPNGVIIIDSQGRVTRCNSNAENLLGTTLFNRTWNTIINEIFQPQADDGYEISLRNGKRIQLATQALASRMGQIIVITDLTETRELQARLNRQQRLSEMGEMFAQLAHQIRTPLSTALIYATNLRQADLSEQQQTQFVSKLLSQLHHIEQQIQELLLYARGEEGEQAEIDIDEFLRDVYDSVEAMLLRTQSQLQIYNTLGEKTLQCSQAALLGALQNLIMNAIQACENHAKLELNVYQDNQQHIVFSLKDNGPGMSDELQRQIMKPFFTTRTQGTGLGLAIVQAVAKAHAGSVSLSSTEGVGSEFSLQLPENLLGS